MLVIYFYHQKIGTRSQKIEAVSSYVAGTLYNYKKNTTEI